MSLIRQPLMPYLPMAQLALPNQRGKAAKQPAQVPPTRFGQIAPPSDSDLEILESFQDAAPEDAGETLGWLYFKEKVHNAMAGLLRLAPAKMLDDMESRNLFAGHYRRDLKVSLPELKKALPDLDMLDKIEEVTFQSGQSGKKIKNHGWYIPAQKGKPTILHSMGNVGSLRSVLRYQPLIDDGYGFMAYEYPGYGSTQGKPTEASINAAGEAASDFLADEKKVPRRQQVVHGISLGGTVTATLAYRLPVKAVIMESTMTSFPDVARLKVKNYAPDWAVPFHEFARSQMASERKMQAVDAPLLVLHGSKDALMPPSFAQRLYQSAATPEERKKLVIFPSQGHNLDTGWTLPYIRRFLANLCSPEQEAAERQRLRMADTLEALRLAQYVQRNFLSYPAKKPPIQPASRAVSPLTIKVVPTPGPDSPKQPKTPSLPESPMSQASSDPLALPKAIALPEQLLEAAPPAPAITVLA